MASEFLTKPLISSIAPTLRKQPAEFSLAPGFSAGLWRLDTFKPRPAVAASWILRLDAAFIGAGLTAPPNEDRKVCYVFETHVS
ncbi:MAG: hypothetical protein DMG05_16020 [Acidobacteria bacterium]|nr:MAG: hypothetical protein DMG05_16020 [Acidobacteriota bacterium]